MSASRTDPRTLRGKSARRGGASGAWTSRHEPGPTNIDSSSTLLHNDRFFFFDIHTAYLEMTVPLELARALARAPGQLKPARHARPPVLSVLSIDYDATRTRAYNELVMTELGPHSLVDWQLVNLSTGTHAHGAEVQIWIGN